MYRKLSIYYGSELSSIVDLEVDNIERSAAVAGVTHYIYPLFGNNSSEVVTAIICKRAKLAMPGYFDGCDGYTLYEALGVLETTQGRSATDKYRFVLDDDKGELLGYYRGYYGNSSREFTPTTMTKANSHIIDVCVQLLVHNFLKASKWGIEPVSIKQIIGLDVIYDNVVHTDEVLFSLYDILIRGNNTKNVTVKSNLKATYRYINDEVAKVIKCDDFEKYFQKLLFLDGVLLNEGHYIDNVYIAYSPITKKYRLLPYFSYTHILGVNLLNIPLEERANKSYGRLIDPEFDVQAMYMKGLLEASGTTFTQECIIVPCKEIFDYINTFSEPNDIAGIDTKQAVLEVMSILGYRCKLFGIDVMFDETESLDTRHKGEKIIIS